ncbi:hypothetical protein BCR34DRAFT_476277 [Clohesyomyces aquaticus]|uniref:RING-type domain-containing protein n=1 Tax=Clohesyomyces aquaticus TaxID=1231657 RepID=A0A1Y2A1Q2_9PLEO|nr:hypothetical protein BCR34DRAFT_476277 [Clohesyomyces aquaticus]
MDDFLQHLQRVDVCPVCQNGFDTQHTPVILDCRHIFGHSCLTTWVRNGRGLTNSCPCCRAQLFSVDNKNVESGADTSSFFANTTRDAEQQWSAICNQPIELITIFLNQAWLSVEHLLSRTAPRKQGIYELMPNVLTPALCAGSRIGDFAPFRRTYEKLEVILEGPPGEMDVDNSYGPLIPLLRLVEMMASAIDIVPKYVRTSPQANMLIWKANTSLGLDIRSFRWQHIVEAVELQENRHWHALWWFTMLISQQIAHDDSVKAWPAVEHRRKDIMKNKFLDRIGRSWGLPSDAFVAKAYIVYEELIRHQVAMKRISLRGKDGEEHIVRGLWQTSQWIVRRA